VRCAPLYDAVTTRVFPGLGGDRMALRLNGKDDRLTRQDFLALARTIGVSAADAETAIAGLTARVADRAKELQLPAFAAETEAANTAQDKVIALVGERCMALGAEGN
jgi:serine/threonine-protein kinase HipA